MGDWSLLDALGAKTRGTVEALAEVLRDAATRERLTLPDYALPCNRALLLAGYPRPAAVALAAVPFALTLFRVRGPPDAERVADLRRYAVAEA